VKVGTVLSSTPLMKSVKVQTKTISSISILVLILLISLGIDANSLNDGNQSFTFIGASDFSGQAGQLRFDGGLLCGDTNGDAVSDFQLAIAGVYSLPVTSIVL
jgi:hypothetical protein